MTKRFRDQAAFWLLSGPLILVAIVPFNYLGPIAIPSLGLAFPLHYPLFAFTGAALLIYVIDRIRTMGAVPKFFQISGLFIGILAFSAAISAHEGTGLRSTLGMALRGWIPAMAAWFLARDERMRERVQMVFIVAGGIAAFGAIFELVTGSFFIFERPQLVTDPHQHWPPESGVAAAALGQPLVLCDFLLLLFPISLARWQERRSKLSIVMAFLMATAIVLTFRRSGYALLVLTVLFFTFRQANKKPVLIRALAFGVFVLLVNLAFPHIRHMTAARFDIKGNITELRSSHRTYTYPTVWKIVKEAPVFGLGTGQYPARYKEFADYENPYSTPDNQYLRTVAENGLVGIIVFFGFVGFILARAAGGRDRLEGWGYWAALANFAVAMFLLDALYWTGLQTAFWAVAGLSCGYARRNDGS